MSSESDRCSERNTPIMMDSSIIRKIDIHGRVVFPKDVRQHMGWVEESLVEIIFIEDGILLKNVKAELDLVKNIQGLNKALEDYSSKFGDERSKKVKDLLSEVLLLLNQSSSED